MNYRQILLFASLLSPLITPADECSSLESISWLTGQWTSVTAKTATSESWQPLNESNWEGSGVARDRTSGELRSVESLRLVVMSGEVFYIAKVDHNKFPVAFKLTECSENKAVFENHTHDFPKKIDYRQFG